IHAEGEGLMTWQRLKVGGAVVLLTVTWAIAYTHEIRAQSRGPQNAQEDGGQADDAAKDNARRLVDEGRRVFRFETFGDEAFWGDALKLHQAIEGAKFGGVGPGVSPKTALAVGLKVD